MQETQETLQRLAREAGPAVVGLGRGWGVGSGVVVGDGRVATNAHNLRGDETTVTFADGRRERGTVAGDDADGDLAVIAVDTAAVAPIAFAAGDPPGIGAAVVALANPGGRGLRVTHGHVSAETRRFRGPRGRRIGGAIEHTAPLPRGSSGGPLVDLEGRLLGLNAVRMEGGLIIAVPAPTGRVDALARGDSGERRRLGVAVASPRAAKRLRRAVGLPDRDGVLVRAVENGGSADKGGIRRGDLIVEAGGVAIDGIDSLYAALDTAGDALALRVVRGADEEDLEIAFAAPGAEQAA
jgi:serine protease Do